MKIGLSLHTVSQHEAGLHEAGMKKNNPKMLEKLLNVDFAKIL